MRNAHDHYCKVLDSETYMNHYKVDISINIFQGEILICGSTIFFFFLHACYNIYVLSLACLSCSSNGELCLIVPLPLKGRGAC